MSTSSIRAVAGSRPARSTAARIATAPSSVAGTVLNAPANLPIGVRAALTMKMSPFGPALGRVMPRIYTALRFEPTLAGSAAGLRPP